MSEFVEAPVTTKVFPSVKNQEDEEEEERQPKIKDGEREEGKYAKNQEKDEEEEERQLKIKDVEREEGKDAKNQEKDDLGRLIEQPHKDIQASPRQKDGQSTPRRKELVLQKLDTSCVKESREEDVQIVSLSIVFPSRPEIILSHPFISSPKACLFTLKEGTKYRLKFSFIVSNKVVSGLKYENTLWKAGIRVDRSTVLLGTFIPRQNPYIYQLGEDTLPSGILVRGLYSARAKNVGCGDSLH